MARSMTNASMVRAERNGRLSIGEVTTIIGFDSAWTDKASAPGAICAIQIDGEGNAVLVAPRLASFAQALEFISSERTASGRCLVALDQPTIVPNLASMRPVERVAASLISWLGGGVQPANRSKIGMFDDAAPVWRFLAALGATEDPERARLDASGLHLIEVFPALAVAALEASFFGRLLGPRYNPARRKTFRLSDWSALLMTVEAYAAREPISGVDHWIAALRRVSGRTSASARGAGRRLVIGKFNAQNRRTAIIL